MYDVVIVGAGPAGTSAALEFARRSDLNILILDKAVLPRKKPCGGAMPLSVEKILNLDLSSIIKNRTQKLKLYHDYEEEVVKSTLNMNAPILIDRSEFDMFLLNKACEIASGKIEIWENSNVQSVVEKETCVQITLNNKQSVQAKYLIAADGALGRTASMVGLMKKRKFAPSLEMEIITDSQYYNDYHSVMIMNYFCVPHGYGWIFPKEKNRFSCGVGTWGKPVNLYRPLDKFISRFFPENSIKEMKISGYPIPIYTGTEQIATSRVFLTGDAASLVDPITGEGIRFALLSGKIAASVMIKSLSDKKAFLEDKIISDEYQKKIYKEIGEELKVKLSFISLAFHNNPHMFYETFVR